MKNDDNCELKIRVKDKNLYTKRIQKPGMCPICGNKLEVSNGLGEVGIYCTGTIKLDKNAYLPCPYTEDVTEMFSIL